MNKPADFVYAHNWNNTGNWMYTTTYDSRDIKYTRFDLIQADKDKAQGKLSMLNQHVVELEAELLFHRSLASNNKEAIEEAVANWLSNVPS